MSSVLVSAYLFLLLLLSLVPVVALQVAALTQALGVELTIGVLAFSRQLRLRLAFKWGLHEVGGVLGVLEAVLLAVGLVPGRFLLA